MDVRTLMMFWVCAFFVSMAFSLFQNEDVGEFVARLVFVLAFTTLVWYVLGSTGLYV